MPVLGGSGGGVSGLPTPTGSDVGKVISTDGSAYLLSPGVLLADGTVANVPADPATATAGSLAVGARADHVHASKGMFWWCGSGTDGDLVYGSGVSTLTNDMQARSLTVSAGARLKTNGFIINVQQTLTNNGRIDADGNNAAGATGGLGASQNSNHLCDGGNGGNGVVGTGGAGSGPARNTIGRSRTAGQGAAGGNAGATLGGTSGNSSGPISQDSYASAQINIPLVRMTGYYLTGTAAGSIGGGGGSGAGAGDGTNTGGGGGGAGGVLIVNARKLTGTGTISVNGGAGGNGAAGNAAGGASGAGGAIFVNVTDIVGWTGTVTASGGVVGTGVGTGQPGSAGSGGVGGMVVYS